MSHYDAKQIGKGDYVSYFGSLADRHDIYFVVSVNANGTYELVMDDEAEVVRLHTVRRQSISRTGGRTNRYRLYT